MARICIILGLICRNDNLEIRFGCGGLLLEKVGVDGALSAPIGCIILGSKPWQVYFERGSGGLDRPEWTHCVVGLLLVVFWGQICCFWDLLEVLGFGEEIPRRGVFHLANSCGSINAHAALN